MRAYDQAKRERFGFRPGDTVRCPSGKRAVLHAYVDGYWRARYIGEPEHTGGVTLQPKHIHLVDEE